MRCEVDVQTDEAGAVKVDGLPAWKPVHVLVEWEEETGLGYPPGWFERVAGSSKDETFLRPSQGEIEKRRKFD